MATRKRIWAPKVTIGDELIKQKPPSTSISALRQRHYRQTLAHEISLASDANHFSGEGASPLVKGDRASDISNKEELLVHPGNVPESSLRKAILWDCVGEMG